MKTQHLKLLSLIMLHQPTVYNLHSTPNSERCCRKAGPHVGNEKPVGSKVIIFSVFLMNIRFSKAEKVEEEEMYCNLFLFRTLFQKWPINSLHQDLKQFDRVRYFVDP